MHTVLVAAIAIAGGMLSFFIVCFIGRFAGFNRLPSG